MAEVNEKSTAYLTVSFKDKAGAAASPSSVTYRVDDVTTGQVVRTSTALTAAASIEITLDATDNAMKGAGNVRETRRVTVQATYGISDTVNAAYTYEVVNIPGVT